MISISYRGSYIKSLGPYGKLDLLVFTGCPAQPSLLDIQGADTLGHTIPITVLTGLSTIELRFEAPLKLQKLQPKASYSIGACVISRCRRARLRRRWRPHRRCANGQHQRPRLSFFSATVSSGYYRHLGKCRPAGRQCRPAGRQFRRR